MLNNSNIYLLTCFMLKKKYLKLVFNTGVKLALCCIEQFKCYNSFSSHVKNMTCARTLPIAHTSMWTICSVPLDCGRLCKGLWLNFFRDSPNGCDFIDDLDFLVSVPQIESDGC